MHDGTSAPKLESDLEMRRMSSEPNLLLERAGGGVQVPPGLHFAAREPMFHLDDPPGPIAALPSPARENAIQTANELLDEGYSADRAAEKAAKLAQQQLHERQPDVDLDGTSAS